MSDGGLDIILPAAFELTTSSLWAVAVLGLAVAAAVDLRRRAVAAWWVVGIVAAIAPLLGYAGWFVLRREAAKRQRSGVETRDPGADRDASEV